jgi:hypothetical protein
LFASVGLTVVLAVFSRLDVATTFDDKTFNPKMAAPSSSTFNSSLLLDILV